MPFGSNETFRQIFQSSVEAIIMVDQQGKILLANPVTERMFGYEQNALIGLVVEDLLPEHLRAKHVEYRKGFTAHPEPRPMGMGRDLVARKKNGMEFPVSVSLSHANINGEILFMAFISDNTERRKSEEALKRSEEQLLIYASELEKKVQSRTEDLNSTINELEKEITVRKRAEEDAHKALDRERDLNELKSKFVSIASHEFRTPLTTVMSSASLIDQYVEHNDIDKVKKHVQRIKSSVNHLTSILNDFLSLGKIEQGRIDVNFESIQLQEFLRDVRDDVTPTLKAGQELKLSWDGKANSISSDQHILRNILFNLISNASKYSDENKVIQLKCFIDNDRVAFAVEDHGIGIPLQEQKHTFDRFFRASNALNVQGTGLGLNIVKRYVELLDGDISFTSEADKGSIFTLRLPLKNNDV